MSDRPRVLLCGFEVVPSPSGWSRRLREYLRVTSQRFQIVALTVKTPDLPHIEKMADARLLRVPVGTGNLESRVQAFERAVKRQLLSEDYPLAHFMDPFSGYVLCEMRPQLGFRVIYEALGFPSLELSAKHPELEGEHRFLSRVRRRELFCLMNADRVVTGSTVTQTFVRNLGVPRSVVRIVRAPVDLEAFDPERLGPPGGAPMRVLYLGSQAPYQGLALLLEGLALALQRTEIALTLAGPRHSDWQPQLQARAAELKISEHVTFSPPVAHRDLPALLAEHDLGVVPLSDCERNRDQGGPLAKCSEYLAAGRPVLASDLPVTRAALPSAATVFFRPDDPRSLAEKLVALAQDAPWRVSLGHEARAFAEAELDGRAARDTLAALYGELLESRARPKRTAPPKPARKLGSKEETRVGPSPLETEPTTTAPAAPAAPVQAREPDTDPSVPPISSPSTAPAAAPPEPEPYPEEIGTEDIIEPEPEEDFPSTVTAEPEPSPEDLPEDSAEELVEADAVDAPPSLPEGAVDPWLAQVVYGYCPPDAIHFARPTPPTNFPGRDG